MDTPFTHPLHFLHHTTLTTELWYIEIGGTRWPIHRSAETSTVLPPLLGGSMDGLTQLVNLLTTDGHEVDLKGFLASEVHGLPLAFTREIPRPHRIVQEIDEAARYTRIAHRSRGRYSARGLELRDTDDVVSVENAWRAEKIEGYLTMIREASARADREGIETNTRLLEGVIEEPNRDEIAESLEHPLMRHFGAYDGSRLVAQSTLYTSDGIIVLKSRHSVRQRPSPQEFLDATVFEILRAEGHDRIERGCTTEAGKTPGLLSYKARFGNLELRREPDLIDVHLYTTEPHPSTFDRRIRMRT